MKQAFTVEVTDTFGGDANYSWVRRYEVKARSFRGAICALSRQYGGHWRKAFDAGDFARYDQQGACVCAFITYSEDA